MNWTEAVAVVFGVVAVALTIRQNLWCWPAGLVQVSLYVYVFYGARLYSDMALHVIYIVLQVYGWLHWRQGSSGAALPVTRLTVAGAFAYAAAIAAFAVVWGEIMIRYTNAAAPRRREENEYRENEDEAGICGQQQEAKLQREQEPSRASPLADRTPQIDDGEDREG